MVNQKKRAIARMMLVSDATRSAGSRISADQRRGGVRALAESHQRLGKVLVGVHRHVAGDVVENIRLRQVVQLIRPRGS